MIRERSDHLNDRDANTFEDVSQIYQAFDVDIAAYRGEAACSKGCAYCCTDAGRIDITTMEGLIIRDAIGRMPRPRQNQVKKALARDMIKRETGQPSACAFLQKNSACITTAIQATCPISCTCWRLPGLGKPTWRANQSLKKSWPLVNPTVL
jgi:hypothetical protein